MKKSLVFLVSILFAAVSFGALSNDVLIARQKNVEKDFAGAVATITAGLAADPSAPSNIVALAHVVRGKAYARMRSTTAALADYDAALAADSKQSARLHATYLKAHVLINGVAPKQPKAGRDLLLTTLTNPGTVPVHSLLSWWCLVGRSYEVEGKLGQAANAYSQMTNMVPTYTSTASHKTWYGTSAKQLGDVLRKDGKEAKANEAYMTYILTALPLEGATNEQSAVWQVFSALNLSAISAVEYKAFLKNAIKSTRNKPDTNKFLGLLSSELDKMNKQ